MEQNSAELPMLVAEEGPLNGQRWILNETTVLGREIGCDIVIADRQVSRYHVRLSSTPDGTLLEDLGSKNGTYYNGEPISEPILLQDGDVIQIALTQKFVYISSDATLPLEGFTHKEIPTPLGGQRLILDRRSHRIWVVGRELIPPLSVAQFHLLEVLYERQGRIVSRSELVEYVWSEEEAVGVSEQALDALIRRLRDRLAELDPTHSYIVTVRGHGLRLENPSMP